MKLHFDDPFTSAHLAYQKDAIDAVCDLFRGQESRRPGWADGQEPAAANGLGRMSPGNPGVGHRLHLTDDELRRNMHQIQVRNGLLPSGELASGDFTVEMETGTGKTYVYLRTLFELYQRYGFSKFIIVTPSIAVTEGVLKTLHVTEEHFRHLYGGIRYEYFKYDSARLGDVRRFADSARIQIMVVTVAAINKQDVNNLYKECEQTGGERPIDLIRAMHPVVVVDEPQSVDGGLRGCGKAALEAMEPLCTLRYSATHLHQHHMVYRLDAVDAYARNLVKQVEVAAATVESVHERAYIRFVAVEYRGAAVVARVELDVQHRAGLRRCQVVVRDGDSLDRVTGLTVYRGFRIGEIRTGSGNEWMELQAPEGRRWLRPGQVCGDAEGSSLPRALIRRTIHEHLAKQQRMRPLGIKVLSLFFIDAVARYRQYDGSGQPVKGEYARIFEEEYLEAIRRPEFAGLCPDRCADPAGVHAGYFSIDRQGRWQNTAENTRSNRENAERAYRLIMREKEALLALDTPLQFIFSHSALREGWDNPNVFQICILRDMHSAHQRRQTIGRGLRLCVNQQGRRVRDNAVNVLTVVANESYEQYAENLQKEIEADTGIRFGVVAYDQFAAIRVTDSGGEVRQLGRARSGAIWTWLRQADYVDGTGKVQPELRRALAAGALEVPGANGEEHALIIGVLRRLSGRLDLGDADARTARQRRTLPGGATDENSNRQRQSSKAVYPVRLDSALIESCIRALRAAPAVVRSHVRWRKVGLAIGQQGVQATEREHGTAVELEAETAGLPDLLTGLQERTELTRRSLHRIITGSGRLDDFRANPQAFIELAGSTINRCKGQAMTGGAGRCRTTPASGITDGLLEGT